MPNEFDYTRTIDMPNIENSSVNGISDFDYRGWVTGVGEAPKDNLLYGRKNGGWAQVIGGGSVSIDNKTIVMDGENNLATRIGGWREVTSDATVYHPMDGHYIPVDGTTITLDTDGNLTVIGGGSGEGFKPFKSAWVGSNLTTAQAVAAILADSETEVGSAFVGTVNWSDLTTAIGVASVEAKAFVLTSTIIQIEATTANVSPYTWVYNSQAATWRSFVPIINNTSTVSTTAALSANMGKSLQDQVNNLKNIGRFLSVWNCSTGLPTSSPETLPYTYKTGDYYRVGAISQTTNYKPDGSTYTGAASTVQETGHVEVGYIYFYDGTTWMLEYGGGGGKVQDVQINGTTIVASGTGIANIPLASAGTSGVVSNIKIGASSILVNGVATIPLASSSAVGAVKAVNTYGIEADANGLLKTKSASAQEIAAKVDDYKPITSAKVSDAIKSGLGNYAGASFSAVEKATARQTIGAIGAVSVEIDL